MIAVPDRPLAVTYSTAHTGAVADYVASRYAIAARQLNSSLSVHGRDPAQARGMEPVT